MFQFEPAPWIWKKFEDSDYCELEECFNCNDVSFNIIKRKCLNCGYELEHNTLEIINFVKDKIIEMTPEEIAAEKKYINESRWKERRIY